MRKLSLLFVTTLLLAACGPKATPIDVSYNMTFKPTLDATHTQELAEASGRTIQGRVESMGGTVTDIKVTNVTENGAEISFTLTPQELLEPLESQLAVVYKLRLMREAKPNEKPTVTIEATGTAPQKGFIETDVSEADIDWVEAEPDPAKPPVGSVYMAFNTAGKAKVKKVFSTTKGLSVGLFVHDRLISSFMNADGLGRENIIIDGVPAVELAEAFADDVNVGTFVTFMKK